MILKISKTQAIRKKLLKQGKIRTLNTPEDLKVLQEMNKDLLEDRRKFRKEQYLSEQSAKNTFFTA